MKSETKPKPEPKNVAFDKDIANRLYEFRMQFVSKSQKEAAELIGITAASLSRAENGLRRVRMDIVEKLVRLYDLNSEWLTTGLGSKQTKEPAKPTAATSLSEAHKEILIIKKMLLVFEANLTFTLDRLEQQNKVIDQLRSEIDALKDS